MQDFMQATPPPFDLTTSNILSVCVRYACIRVTSHESIRIGGAACCSATRVCAPSSRQTRHPTTSLHKDSPLLTRPTSTNNKHNVSLSTLFAVQHVEASTISYAFRHTCKCECARARHKTCQGSRISINISTTTTFCADSSEDSCAARRFPVNCVSE